MTTKLKTSDSYFIQVDVEFATAYGLNEATVAGKMLRLQDKLEGVIDDNGDKWIRLTLEEWMIEIPFIKEMTLRRTIESLEEQGILFSRTFSGRPKWYRLNPEYVDTQHNVSVQNEQIHYDNCAKRADASVQNEQLPIVQSYKKQITPNGVNGEPLSAKNDEKPKPKKPTPEQPGPRKRLMGTFLTSANMSLPRNKKTEGFWWSQITDLEGVVNDTLGGDVSCGQEIIAEVVKDMRRDKLSIGGPQSIVNLFRDRASTRASPGGNHASDLSPQQLKQIRNFDL